MLNKFSLNTGKFHFRSFITRNYPKSRLTHVSDRHTNLIALTFSERKQNLNMMKHRRSIMTVEKSLNSISTYSGDYNETIVAGNIETSSSAPDILDITDNIADVNFGEVKTSTKRKNMEEDLKNVWDILSIAYRNQKEREKNYLKANSKSRHSSSTIMDDTYETIDDDDQEDRDQDKTEIFHMDKTVMIKENSLPKTWNNGEISTNAIQEPWVMKYKYDDDGFKIYEEVEFNSTVTKTLEGSFSSVSSSDSLDETKPNKKRSLRRSLTKIFSRPMKIRRN